MLIWELNRFWLVDFVTLVQSQASYTFTVQTSEWYLPI